MLRDIQETSLTSVTNAIRPFINHLHCKLTFSLMQELSLTHATSVTRHLLKKFLSKSICKIIIYVIRTVLMCDWTYIPISVSLSLWHWQAPLLLWDFLCRLFHKYLIKVTYWKTVAYIEGQELSKVDHVVEFLKIKTL